MRGSLWGWLHCGSRCQPARAGCAGTVIEHSAEPTASSNVSLSSRTMCEFLSSAGPCEDAALRLFAFGELLRERLLSLDMDWDTQQSIAFTPSARNREGSRGIRQADSNSWRYSNGLTMEERSTEHEQGQEHCSSQASASSLPKPAAALM